MSFFFLTTAGLSKKLELNKLDEFSMMMAALCHDLGHDGLTNGYHVNAFTKRSILSNDISVQETYHVSKMFEILSQPNCNFTENFTKEEFKVFRMRTIGLILATDMAKHMDDMSQLKALLETEEIS